MRPLFVPIVLLIAALPVLGADSVEKLVADLGHQDSNRRVAALNELRRLKDPRAVPIILRHIEEWEYLGQYYAVLALEIYPPEIVDVAYRTLAKSESSYLRLCAGAGLYRTGDKRGADLVVRALGEEVEESALVQMISRLYAVRDPKVQAKLRGFLTKDTSETILVQALTVLHSHQDTGALADCRRLIEKDERGGIRALAAAYLYRFGEEDHAATLARELRTGELSTTIIYRIDSFLSSAGSVAQEILAAFADLIETETDPNVLGRAIRMLGKYRYTKARKILKELLASENSTVAKAAFEALASMPGSLDDSTLRPLLKSEDPDRRLWAADALRRMDDLTGLPAVIEVLKTGNNTQRYEAAKVLGGFRVSAAVEPLLDALMDEYSSVRSYAASGLAQILRSLYPYRNFDFNSAGYSYSAPEAKRRLAAERIRKWWVENRNRDW